MEIKAISPDLYNKKKKNHTKNFSWHCISLVISWHIIIYSSSYHHFHQKEEQRKNVSGKEGILDVKKEVNQNDEIIWKIKNWNTLSIREFYDKESPSLEWHMAVNAAYRHLNHKNVSTFSIIAFFNTFGWTKLPTQLKYQIMAIPVVVQEIMEISPQPKVQQVIETILKVFYIWWQISRLKSKKRKFQKKL